MPYICRGCVHLGRVGVGGSKEDLSSCVGGLERAQIVGQGVYVVRTVHVKHIL